MSRVPHPGGSAAEGRGPPAGPFPFGRLSDRLLDGFAVERGGEEGADAVAGDRARVSVGVAGGLFDDRLNVDVGEPEFAQGRWRSEVQAQLTKVAGGFLRSCGALQRG